MVGNIGSTSSRRWISYSQDAVLVGGAILMVVTMYMVFLWVPTESNLGVSQRIFYFHVPLAWIGMISIILVSVSSALHLITGREKWDNLAYAGAEVGVVFFTLLLATGVMWSKPVWGVWWTWDAKLTTTLILWFIYVSYIMLRAYGPKGSQGARYGAVIALIGAIDTPIIYMATVWWRTAHPEMNIGPLAESGSMHPSMQFTLMVSLIFFTLLYICVLIQRLYLRRSENMVDELYYKIG